MNTCWLPQDRASLTELPKPADGSLRSQAEKAAQELLEKVGTNDIDLVKAMRVAIDGFCCLSLYFCLN